ncbi:MAG: hypothetical protein V9H26_19795 [Verrucomicrobiota bacterium]
MSAAVALAESPEAIQRVTLDERVVVTVPVATNRVTTISFPGPIAAIDAVGVTADGKTPGQFQLAHTKGSSFLSVRALARKAATNLNIRWNKRTYVFELVESDTSRSRAEPGRPRRPPRPFSPRHCVTPTRLLALLDKAKAFPLLKKQQPDAVAGAEARTFGEKPQVTDFNDYEIRIEEVFRFNPEDTLVFHVTLQNKSDREIRYLPESFCRPGRQPALLPVHQRRAGRVAAAMPPARSISASPAHRTADATSLSLKNEFTRAWSTRTFAAATRCRSHQRRPLFP